MLALPKRIQYEELPERIQQVAQNLAEELMVDPEDIYAKYKYATIYIFVAEWTTYDDWVCDYYQESEEFNLHWDKETNDVY